MILVIDSPGFSLGKKSVRIVVRYRDGSKQEVPIVDLDLVVVSARGSISTDAIRLLSLNNIPVIFAGRFSPYATTHPFFMHATVITRREQMRALYDERGAYLARMFCYATTMNKVRVLQYFAKSRSYDSDLVGVLREHADRIRAYAEMIKNTSGSLDSIRMRIMGYEGEAASIYFDALRLLVPEDLGFGGRDKRPPRDPVNSVLSYGYTILNSICTLAISKCGLEPFAGFLHADRSGKHSLVLDLSEEFRQPFIDIMVVGLFSKKSLDFEHFDYRDDGTVYLNDRGKPIFFDAFNNRLKMRVKTPYGKQTTFRGAIMRQARNIVRFLLGIRNEYRPFIWRWS